MTKTMKNSTAYGTIITVPARIGYPSVVTESRKPETCTYVFLQHKVSLIFHINEKIIETS